MKLQVLVSTMNQIDYDLLKKMNINSDSIIINQCNRNEVEDLQYNGNKIKWFSMNEKGVGLSRNTALMRASSDICIFADDDMKYINNYEEKIIDAFTKLPYADIIIFDVKIINSSKKTANFRKINRIKRLHLFNSMRYGACRIAIRRSSIIKSNTYFSLLFGGGAKYSAGEDSLFIRECLKKSLKIYAYPLVIAEVNDENSTWYVGINDKLLEDKGALLSVAYPQIYPALFIYYAIKMSVRIKKMDYSLVDLIKKFYNGRNNYYSE